MFLRHSLACFCEPVQIMSLKRWMKHVLPDLLGWFPCTITRGHELSQLFLKQICLLINHILSHAVWEPWWRREAHEIMHTHIQQPGLFSSLGFPSWRKGAHKVLSALRDLLHRAQCAVTITPRITSETANKTYLTLINHFPGSWEQDFSQDTMQPSSHCPFLWAYLRKSRCRQDIAASLLKE